MFSDKESYLLSKIIEKINNIENICKHYDTSLEKALEDEILGRAAILMHLEAIAEQFEKLFENSAFDILKAYDKEDIKGIRRVRNYIAHQYDEVDNEVIFDIINTRLPIIKSVSLSLMQTDIDSGSV